MGHTKNKQIRLDNVGGIWGSKIRLDSIREIDVFGWREKKNVRKGYIQRALEQHIDADEDMLWED